MKKNKLFDIKKTIKGYVKELKASIDALDCGKIEDVINTLMNAYRNNKKVFIMGNGGSAANSSHFACDLSKNTLERVYDHNEKGFKVYSLTDNVALMTAFANDLSYDDIFIQQLRHLVEKDDVVIVLSGSGNSKNVIKAVNYAKKCKATTIGILGFKNGGRLGKLVDISIIAQSNSYGISEDIQLILDHIITSCLGQIKKAHNKKRAV